jgi:hypothetical protein
MTDASSAPVQSANAEPLALAISRTIQRLERVAGA